MGKSADQKYALTNLTRFIRDNCRNFKDLILDIKQAIKNYENKLMHYVRTVSWAGTGSAAVGVSSGVFSVVSDSLGVVSSSTTWSLLAENNNRILRYKQTQNRILMSEWYCGMITMRQWQRPFQRRWSCKQDWFLASNRWFCREERTWTPCNWWWCHQCWDRRAKRWRWSWLQRQGKPI
jgi:hypothetical protein